MAAGIFAGATPEGASHQPMIRRLQEAIRFLRQNGDAKKARNGNEMPCGCRTLKQASMKPQH